jgi:flagellar protein FlaG
MEIGNIGMGNGVGTQEQNFNVERSAKQDNSNNKFPSDKRETKGDDKELNKAVDTANKVLFKNNTHLKFEIHEKTKDVMVKIVNDSTGEVIKEIPPEKMLDMVAKLWEIAGILVDEKR